MTSSKHQKNTQVNLVDFCKILRIKTHILNDDVRFTCNLYNAILKVSISIKKRFILTMTIRKLKFLCAAMLCIKMIQLPLEATISNEIPSPIKSITFTDGITPSVYIAAGLYIGYNYLVRQEYLVKNRYPIAYAWYEALTLKYPSAHFATKQFVAKPSSGLIANQLASWIKSCSWTSNYNHIYFTDNALLEITYLYKKVMDGYSLNEQEQLALARQEFILLHEAGHIEHNDAKDILITIIGLLAITQGSEYVYDTIIEPVKTKTSTVKKKEFFLESTFGKNIEIPGIASSSQGITFIAGIISMLRYQQSRAHKFACKLADTATLQGAITLFENDSIDELYDLENKKMTPYIKTNSTVGIMVQNVFGPIELIASVLVQQVFLVVKSIPELRWTYDFVQDPIHIGPSVRAQLMKDELARREQNKQ